MRRTATAARSVTGSCSASARPPRCARRASWTASSPPCRRTPRDAGCPSSRSPPKQRPRSGRWPRPGLGGVWQRLGMDRWFATLGDDRGAEVLAHAVFAMVANRLVDPCSNRRLPEWVEGDVTMPAAFTVPSADQWYRALDVVADTNQATETELHSTLCDLANMDLRLVCYDLTSTYFEGSTRPAEEFPSKAFGYSHLPSPARARHVPTPRRGDRRRGRHPHVGDDRPQHVDASPSPRRCRTAGRRRGHLQPGRGRLSVSRAPIGFG